MSNKELNIEFKNWKIEDIIVELARYIEKGYRLASYNTTFGFHDCNVEVTLVHHDPYVKYVKGEW